MRIPAMWMCFLLFLGLRLSTVTVLANPVWDGLRVTFDVNMSNPYAFASLPRTECKAKREGFVKISDCDNNGQFRGKRYVKDNDYAVVLLFDRKGHIAGIQSGVAKSTLPSNYPPTKQLGKIFQDDGDRYTLTAYFTDPALICTCGRTASEFNKTGTGTDLYIQTGTDPVTQNWRMPKTGCGIASTAWKYGRCYPAMGKHYWYNITKDMSCDDFQPVYLMFEDNLLKAFGWALLTRTTSKRFEHPTHQVIGAFMNPVPTCYLNYSHLSAMHIYLTASPWSIACPATG